jgi:Ser/Thr protein kinase RdoA (MazF antagonist)
MSDLAREVVRDAAQQLLGPIERLERIERGYGNQNWRVDSAGLAYLIKIGKRDADVGKAVAASNAYRLAATTSAPVPELVHFDPHCELLDERIVRILRFLPGRHPEQRLAAAGPAAITTFFSSFGSAVAQLHSARCPNFSSRVGGGPGFESWIDYVEYRAPQIVERCLRSGAFTETEIITMYDRVLRVAREVSPLVEPRLSHRDLYLDNVLISDDGAISAILDLDLAEQWDPVVDFVKPRSQIFPCYPEAAEAFEDGYAAVAGGLPPAWEQRIRVVEVMELSNHVANSTAGGNPDYADHNRRRLEQVLAGRW